MAAPGSQDPLREYDLREEQARSAAAIRVAELEKRLLHLVKLFPERFKLHIADLLRRCKQAQGECDRSDSDLKAAARAGAATPEELRTHLVMLDREYALRCRAAEHGLQMLSEEMRDFMASVGPAVSSLCEGLRGALAEKQGSSRSRLEELLRGHESRSAGAELRLSEAVRALKSVHHKLQILEAARRERAAASLQAGGAGDAEVLREALRKAESERDGAKASAEKETRSSAVLRDLVVSLEERLGLAAKEGRTQSASPEFAELRERFRQAAADRDSLQSRVDEAEVRLAASAAELREINIRLKAAEGERDQAAAKGDRASRPDELRAALAADDSMTRVSADMESLRERLGEALADRDATKEVAEAAQQAMTTLLADVAKLRERCLRAERELASRVEEISALKARHGKPLSPDHPTQPAF